MATVRKILELPRLKGLKVVAGQSGIDQHVSCVTVMEVPDITKWLKRDTFLITSLYSVRDSVHSQCRLIESLARSSCSCVAVKTGQYVKKIEVPLCETADKLGLPLIQIPYSISYIDLILNAMTLILEENNNDVILEKYIRDVVFSLYEEESLMVEKGSMIGLNPASHFYLFLVFQLEPGSSPGTQEASSLRAAVRSVACYASGQPAVSSSHVVPVGDNQTLLIEAETPESLEKFLPFLQAEVQGQLSYYFPEGRIHLGIGTAGTGLQGIRDSYRNASRAIRAGLIFHPERSVYNYQDLEIYCLLNNAISASSGKIAEKILGRVNNRELLETLDMYYECNASIRQTADRLFVHKNTVIYRLQRIHEITGLNVKNHDDDFRLYLAVLSRKIQKSNQTL